MRTVITGTGSFIPATIKSNDAFAARDFYDADQRPIPNAAKDIVRKFEQVTGIYERRYADSNMNASDMAAFAAEAAIRDSGIDRETLDQVIVAHNFGNVIADTIQSDAVPSIASRVKQALGIKNPACIPYDILFGCPGWIQGLIQADAFIKTGLAKKCLVIGAETLSRVIDEYDRDSMIFSDGAGATIVEGRETGVTGLPGITAPHDRPAGTTDPNGRQHGPTAHDHHVHEVTVPNNRPAGIDSPGILGTIAQSFALEEAEYIYMGKSNFPDSDHRIRYLKMQGRKVYEFALRQVPAAMKACLEVSNVQITELKKIFIHQANEKMDIAIIKAFYLLFGITEVPDNIMPMNIRELGNSSVATVPTLLDMVKKGLLPEHRVNPGDAVLFASVGAGMNINAICYRA